jgi:heat shock protein HslJ
VAEQPISVRSPYDANWYHAKKNIWQLVSLEKDGVIIKLHGEDYQADEITGIFILRFSDGDETKNAFGKGAPNRYWAALEFGDDSIGFLDIATTRIEPNPELEILKEQEYFAYLKKVSRWALNDSGNLLLSTWNEEGERVILIFKAL